ncbi:hypothetical protein SALBM135S_01966 [Streptomyces alboniger]
MKTGRTIRTAAATVLATAVLAVGSAGSATAGPAAATGAEWRLCMYLGAHPTLQVGSSGEAVRHLQCVLNEVYRYQNVPRTGVFEEVTRASVEHLQLQFSKPQTGVVDAVTWGVLHP